MVTLMTESYFWENIQHLIPTPTPGGINAHNLFNLKGVGGTQVPLSRYFTADIKVGGITVPDVEILVKTNRQLETSKGIKTKLPCIIGCNLLKIAVTQFIKDYGEEALRLFECLKDLDPLFFSCLLLYYYSRESCEHTDKEEVVGCQWQRRGGGSPWGEIPLGRRRFRHWPQRF